jgi:hypothetical protein
MTALVVLVVAVVPTLALVALLGLVDRAQRARSEVIARQVAVTDAIHRELGAIVAPTVTRRRRGAWQVLIAVPFERPAAVASVVAIAHRALAAGNGTLPDRVRIVLLPQGAPALPGARFTR